MSNSEFDKYLEELDKRLKETPDQIRERIWKKALDNDKDYRGPTLDEYFKILQSVPGSALYRT